jgi:hypothetical protein
MLDEIHLVDVAARDRPPHRLDRRAVVRIAPAALPAAEEIVTVALRRRLGRGPDPAREERQRGAGLRRRREQRTTERFREPVPEIEVGDDVVPAPEPFVGEIRLERGEGARRFAKLDQRRLPRVIR